MMKHIEMAKAEEARKAREKQVQDEDYHRKAILANEASKRAREEAQRQVASLHRPLDGAELVYARVLCPGMGGGDSFEQGVEGDARQAGE